MFEVKDLSNFYRDTYHATSTILTITPNSKAKGRVRRLPSVIFCPNVGITKEEAISQAQEISLSVQKTVTMLFCPANEIGGSDAQSSLRRGEAARDLVTIISRRTRVRTGWSDFEHIRSVRIFAHWGGGKCVRAALKVIDSSLRHLVIVYTFNSPRKIPNCFAHSCINFVTTSSPESENNEYLIKEVAPSDSKSSITLFIESVNSSQTP